MLSKQAIEEFQALYLETHGIELPAEEALQQASQMVRLYKVVLGYPSSNEHMEDSNDE